MPIEATKELEAPPAPESYVYMFYSAGKIKIGYTLDPIQRLDALNNSSDYERHIYSCEPGEQNT